MTPRDQPDPRIGSAVGDRYRLDGVIGRGGMGAVYRARDLELGRDVAVKLFSTDGHERGDLSRQVSEVRLLASLNHPALVTLYDARVEGDGHADDAYLVMELVDGPTLQTVLSDGPLAHADAAALLQDVADGLAAVHRAGVVHRDVKPANILLAAPHHDGAPRRAKLADFGIAYLIDSTRVTATGTLMGTAAFVSPEQAEGRPPAAASDVYSLGLVLVEALTGRRVFTGSVVESVMARLTRDPEIPTSIGSGWAELLTRMTARAPEARPTATEVARAARALAVDGAGSTDQATRVMTSPDSPMGALPGGDLPTRVLPASPDRTTRVLPAGAASTTAAQGDAGRGDPTRSLTDDADVSSSGRRRRRLPLVIAAVAVLALLAVGLGWAATRDGETGSTPETVPSSETTSEVEPTDEPATETPADEPAPAQSTAEVPAEPAPSQSSAPSEPVEPTTDPVPDVSVPPVDGVVPGVGSPGNSGKGNGNGNGKDKTKADG